MTRQATVLGASGFVGGALARHLTAQGYDVATPARDTLADLSGDTGHLFYCIGMTGDFRSRPYDTIDAQAGLLSDLLRRVDYASLTYLSSTRVYSPDHEVGGTSEDGPVLVNPTSDATYDLSKLLGEALCMAQKSDTARAVRLSNVYGLGQSKQTFLGSVIADLQTKGTVTFGESPQSSKDYVALQDVVHLMEMIATKGTARRYNIASGHQTPHSDLASVINETAGMACDFAPNGNTRRFPQIDISRIRSEFGFSPRALLDDLPDLLHGTPNV